MKKKYIIQDWTGKLMNTAAMVVAYKSVMKKPKQEFKSFDEAEYFLSVVLGDSYEEDRQEYYIEERE